MEVVSILRDNSLRLQRMIEELLEHQRALRAAADLRIQSVDLAALVRARIASHQLVADARGLNIVLDLDDIVLNADREKLGSIVDNLVGNALKFAPRGGRIEVFAKRDEGFAAIEVRDSGPGIAAGDRAMIFDSFSAAVSGSTRAFRVPDSGWPWSGSTRRRMAGAWESWRTPGAHASACSCRSPPRSCPEPDIESGLRAPERRRSAENATGGAYGHGCRKGNGGG